VFKANRKKSYITENYQWSSDILSFNFSFVSCKAFLSCSRLAIENSRYLHLSVKWLTCIESEWAQSSSADNWLFSVFRNCTSWLSFVCQTQILNCITADSKSVSNALIIFIPLIRWISGFIVKEKRTSMQGTTGPGRHPLAYLLYCHYDKLRLCINIHHYAPPIGCSVMHPSCNLIGCRMAWVVSEVPMSSLKLITWNELC